MFFGKCETELKNYESAKKSYCRAIDQNKDQILAWQVIIENSFYNNSINRVVLFNEQQYYGLKILGCLKVISKG